MIEEAKRTPWRAILEPVRAELKKTPLAAIGGVAGILAFATTVGVPVFGLISDYISITGYLFRWIAMGISCFWIIRTRLVQRSTEPIPMSFMTLLMMLLFPLLLPHLALNVLLNQSSVDPTEPVNHTALAAIGLGVKLDFALMLAAYITLSLEGLWLYMITTTRLDIDRLHNETNTSTQECISQINSTVKSLTDQVLEQAQVIHTMATVIAKTTPPATPVENAQGTAECSSTTRSSSSEQGQASHMASQLEPS